MALCPRQAAGWPRTVSTGSVRTVNRPLFALFVAALTGASTAAVVSACSSDSSSTPAASDAATGPASDAMTADVATTDAGTGGNDAATASICDLTRAYVLDCNAGPDAGDQLTCGPAGFDTWCPKNDQAINSDAYRRAESMCLTHANCANGARRDCELRSYATATPSAAQKNVVAAYCATCEPAEAGACATRETTYDPAKGPDSIDDVFVAAWELNDALDDQIRAKCTGTALDGGIDDQLDGGAGANACLKAFGSCAGDIYVNALPDCPK